MNMQINIASSRQEAEERGRLQWNSIAGFIDLQPLCFIAWSADNRNGNRGIVTRNKPLSLCWEWIPTVSNLTRTDSQLIFFRNRPHRLISLLVIVPVYDCYHFLPTAEVWRTYCAAVYFCLLYQPGLKWRESVIYETQNCQGKGMYD